MSNSSSRNAWDIVTTALFILGNYAKNGYKNVIVSDFEDIKLKQLQTLFSGNLYLIFTLFVTDEEELKKRVLTQTRDSGFRDVEKSIQWNEDVKEREVLQNETKIDNTKNSPERTLQIILDQLEG